MDFGAKIVACVSVFGKRERRLKFGKRGFKFAAVCRTLKTNADKITKMLKIIRFIP
jgi:hypothetical protein